MENNIGKTRDRFAKRNGPNQDGNGPMSRKTRVYMDFYYLNEAPFSITPDPDFLYFSHTHKQVIEKILYGISNHMGFILLTGEVGTGKTTICRALLDRLNKQAHLVYIINPSLTGKELISSILDDLGIPYPEHASKKDLIHHLNRFLLETANKKTVVIIVDDAQTMPIDALEDLRLLSNLETDKEKLLQLLLIGQPEFLEMLEHAKLRQLKQRLSINCRLVYLEREEVNGYISRRLFVAGNHGQIRFSPQAVKRITKASQGIPRLINKICDHALTAAYVGNEFVITSKHVKTALRELDSPWGNQIDSREVVFPTAIRCRRKIIYAFCTALVVLVLNQLADFNHLADSFVSRFPSPAEHSPPADLRAEGYEPAGEPDFSMISTPICKPKASKRPFHPYTLLLGSFKTLKRAQKSVLEYAEKGIQAHWNCISQGSDGIWYRVFTGHFSTKESALKFQKIRGLDASLVLCAPWTVSLNMPNSMAGGIRVQNILKENRLNWYPGPKKDRPQEIRLGVFTTQRAAQRLSKRVSNFGLQAKALLR